ncbi:hypothetical protein HaLaN_08910, partial [Haematococcus lacustris]
MEAHTPDRLSIGALDPQPDTPPSASSILEHALDELRRCKSTTLRLASHTPKTSESLLATLAYVDTELSSTSQASHVSEDDEEDSSYLKPLSPMQPVGHGGWTGPSMLSRTTGLGLAAKAAAASPGPRFAFLKNIPRATGCYAAELDLPGGPGAARSAGQVGNPLMTFLVTDDNSRSGA